MRKRLGRAVVAAVLRLYPRPWRARYGEEMTALLSQHRVTLRTIVDLALGAADARIQQYLTAAERRPAEQGPRPVYVAALAGAVCLGLGFLGVRDTPVGTLAWTDVAAAFQPTPMIVHIAGCVAVLATATMLALLGRPGSARLRPVGLLITTWAVLSIGRFAFPREGGLVAALATATMLALVIRRGGGPVVRAAIAVAAWFVLGAVVGAIAPSPPHLVVWRSLFVRPLSPVSAIAQVDWVLASLGAAVLCVAWLAPAGPRRAVDKRSVPLAFWAAWAAVVALAVRTAGSAVLLIEMPAAFVGVSTVTLFGLALAGILAALAFRRGRTIGAV